MAKWHGKDFTLDVPSEILTQRVTETATVFAKCVNNIYVKPDKRLIDEQQGETKGYNLDYLFYLFVGHFSCTVTQFEERRV